MKVQSTFNYAEGTRVRSDLALQQSGAQKPTVGGRDYRQDQRESAADPRPVAAVDQETVEEIVRDLNRQAAVDKGIRFELADDGNNFTVQVVDRNSDEVIRSIPTEGLAEFRENFRESTGVLLDRRA